MLYFATPCQRWKWHWSLKVTSKACCKWIFYIVGSSEKSLFSSWQKIWTLERNFPEKWQSKTSKLKPYFKLIEPLFLKLKCFILVCVSYFMFYNGYAKRIFLKISEYQNLTCFYLIERSFDFALKVIFSQNCEVATRNAPHTTCKHCLVEDPGGSNSVYGGALCSVSPGITQMMGRIKNLSPKNALSAFPGAAPSRGLFANSPCYFSCWQL